MDTGKIDFNLIDNDIKKLSMYMGEEKNDFSNIIGTLNTLSSLYVSSKNSSLINDKIKNLNSDMQIVENNRTNYKTVLDKAVEIYTNSTNYSVSSFKNGEL